MNDSDNAITRRRFLQASIAGSAALAGLPSMAFARIRPRFDKPPNFVVILADDLGYGDLSCYGSKTISTPRVDRMAAEGVRFTDFYSAAAVCTPSRAALMTACYPIRVNLPSVLNQNSTIGINSSEITMAQMLKACGYATCCIGKWHLGYQKPFLPIHHGFDYYYGLPYSNDMPGTKGVPLYRNDEIIEQPVVQETLTERYTDEAVKFITANNDKPFLVYLPHTFPHVPLSVTERFKGKSKGGLYGDVVECIDWSTGRILDTLAKLGLDDNTLVVFTSDNGPWMRQGANGGSAGPLRDSKATTWEGGMRMPCIVRWPGQVPAGTVCSEVAAMFDFFPTFAGLAGGQVPTDRIIDGRDIWPLISGQRGAASPHEAFYYYWKDELQAVRSGKWKLAFDRKKAPNNPEIVRGGLFDLEKDIGETTDVSASYPKVVERLRALAETMRADLGDALTNRPGPNRRPAGQV